MIYVFLAPGFEEMEALAPVDILRRAELDVCTVGVGSKAVTGAHGITVAADLCDSDAAPDDMEAVVLPGGMPGTLHLEQSQTVMNFLDYAVKVDAHIAAICAAPSILGHRGLLKGKNAVCFPGFENELIGAQLSDQPVVIDGKIVTAKGAGVAVDFGLALVGLLKNEARAKLLRKSLQCR
ncbi:MAG: DJ-1/PfpI family protein [Clostridiales bacterium]|nr:DJ-1/PfpI family protein [Clostridiales bacterium]